MAAIGWYFYILVGLVISVLSWIIKSQKNPSMIFFFWVGLVFVTIGIFKLIFKQLAKEKKEENVIHHQHNIHHSYNQQFAQSQNTNKNAANTQRAMQKTQVQPQQQSSASNVYQIVTCTRCGQRQYLSNFCNNCGNRLR